MKNPDLNTEEGAAQYRTHLNEMTKKFIDYVAKYRNTKSETILKDFGRGDIVNAENALQAGMIDVIGNFSDAISVARNLSQSTTQNKNIKRKNAMAKKIKNELVLVDDEMIDEGIETLEITIETIKDKFPEIADALIQEGKDSADVENEEINEIADSVNIEDEDEMDAVQQARAGKITASELTKKLFLISRKPEKKAKPKNAMEEMLDKRGQDQPDIESGGGDAKTTETKKDEATVLNFSKQFKKN